MKQATLEPPGRTVAATMLLLALVAADAAHAGDPPPGPPWRMTYRDARRAALRASRPVFVYFTKTY